MLPIRANRLPGPTGGLGGICHGVEQRRLTGAAWTLNANDWTARLVQPPQQRCQLLLAADQALVLRQRPIAWHRAIDDFAPQVLAERRDRAAPIAIKGRLVRGQLLPAALGDHV